MKQLFTFSAITLSLSLFPSTSNTDDSEALKNMVLCNYNYGLKEVVTKIDKEDGYKKDSRYFYTPKEAIKVFGYKIKYVGLSGVDMISGPNITLKGKFNKVKEKVLKMLDQKFECGPEICVAQMPENNQIMVHAHPTDKKLTIIQCAYIGP